MHTYITVAAWSGVIAVVFRLLGLAFLDYPRERKVTQASEVIALVINAAFLFWSARLLGWI
jgi:hypothetical protein